jgi:hypothetical protein
LPGFDPAIHAAVPPEQPCREAGMPALSMDTRVKPVHDAAEKIVADTVT